ncbi:hypothetical protein Ancab_026560 [Ancistrocladus abbreviatus]
MENELNRSVVADQLPSVDNFKRRDDSLIGSGDVREFGGAELGGASGAAGGGQMRAVKVGIEVEGAGPGACNVKKKRGRPSRGQAKTTRATSVVPLAKKFKKEEEDVCFICFDGGTLVLCDRRDCPKAYHPSCVKRDEAFFRGRVRWNCGWHICNLCQKNAHFMCYTCPYSLCKGCVKQADILSVRGSKGFCRTCMTTILLIENIAQGTKDSGQVDFDDKSSWEYLFKVYWIYLKQKESLTLDELTRATNPWKGSGLDHKDDFSQKMFRTSINKASVLGSTNASKRRKIERQPQLHNRDPQRVEKVVDDKVQHLHAGVDWASKELLEFVAHMKNGNTSILSQCDVQALLLEYIRKNNLCDPRQKYQVACDQRLETLFGKARVDHLEMLKLLEYHFREDLRPSGAVQAAVKNPVTGQVETEGSSEVIQNMHRDKKRRTCRKCDERGQHTSLDNYAAINVHNIKLIYLKRNLMENLMDDAEKFNEKVVGSIVRIRISGNDQKQEIYRLVRVVGTIKAAEPYKIGNKTANFMLKILNLNRIEDITIDIISNQEFCEDECRRLRQSIKCGLVERMTVGEIQEKAVALQAARINDLLETEILRLNHLRDRASEMRHGKELKECVEKLELLNTPEERQCMLNEIPEVHADPRMDPSYESDEDTGQSEITKGGFYLSKGMELTAPQRVDDVSHDTGAEALRSPTCSWEHKRNGGSKFQPGKEEVAAGTNERDCESPQTLEGADAVSRILVELRNGMTLSAGFAICNSGGLDKIWHYQDPSGKVQGPFCMLQLRKWSSNGYFPAGLRVWRIDESKDQSILLTDALAETGCVGIKYDDSKADSVTALRGNNDAPWTDQRNGKSCSDLMQPITCSYTDEQLVSRPSNRKETNTLNDSDGSPEQKKKPDSLNSEVSNSCAPSACCLYGTMDEKSAVEFSHLSSPTQLVNEASEGESVENGRHATSDATGQNLGNSQSVSSVGIEFPEPPRLIPKPDHKDPDVLVVHSKNSVAEIASGKDLGIDSGVAPAGVPPDAQSPGETKVQAAEVQQSVASNIPGQDSGTSWSTVSVGVEFRDLPTTAPEQENVGTKVQVVEEKQYLTSNIPCPDPVVSWSTTSSLVGSIVELPDIAGTWSGYSHMHEKASVEELDSGLASGSSMKQIEPSSDHATPTPESCQLTPSPTHPDYAASRWHGMKPLELSTLGDESVSDLLSEVEALESLHRMASPTSRMNCGEDSIDSPGRDCFSPLVGLSPPLDPGKHDAMSSTCDIHFHSHPITTDGPHGAFPIDVNAMPKMSGAHSSSSPEGEGEFQPAFVSIQQAELVSPAQPSATLPVFTMGHDSSANHVTGVGLKPTYSMHLQKFVSQTCSSAPSWPALLTSSLSSSISITAGVEVKPNYVSMHQPELASRSHPPTQLPLPTVTLESAMSSGEGGEVKPAYVSMHEHELVSQPHSPASSSPPPSTKCLDSSISLGSEGDSRSAYVSIHQQDFVAQPESHAPAQVLLPRVSVDSAVSPQEMDEVKTAYVSLHQLDSVSKSHPPVQTPLPMTRPDSSMNPAEEGELKPTYASMHQDAELVSQSHPPAQLPLPSSSLDSISSPGEEGELKSAAVSMHQQEFVPRSHLPAQPPLIPTGVDPVKSPGEGGELKPHDDSIPQLELISQSHPPTLQNNSLDVAAPDAPRRLGSGAAETSCRTVREHATSLRSGTVSGSTNMVRGTGHVMSPRTANMQQRGSFAVRNQGVQASQQSRHSGNDAGRHSGPKDRSYHRVDSSSNSRSRPSWNRQASFGSDRGSSRPPHTPRGQRICKFYESGHCKKGASCNYLHP